MCIKLEQHQNGNQNLSKANEEEEKIMKEKMIDNKNIFCKYSTWAQSCDSFNS